MHPASLLISAALSISVSTHLHALAPALEEVVVTGMRQQNRLAELPYSAYTLNQEALQRSRSLPEALAGQPGVLVQKTANGHGSPFIRGFTGYRTLALIDGVRYNNSVYRDGPNEYFALIDSQSLASLELFNGPASVLYGSDAVGGTLNLRSRQSSYTEQLGSFWQLGQSLVYSSAERSVRSRTELDLGQGDSWGLLAGFSRKHFGDIKAAGLGTLPTTGYDERAHDLRVDTQLNSHWSLSALGQQLSQDDVWRSHSTIYAKPFAGSSVGDDLRRLKDQRRRLHYIKLNGQALGLIDDLQLTLSRQHWREHGQRQRANGSGLREYFDSRMDGLDLQLQSQFGQHRWLYGIDFYRDQVDSGRRDYSAAGELSQIHIQGPVG
ncbi:MAG: TonB-dependent receptor plug domain-containing protein, partial [Cellvibrionaceae bacterium]|nr:TonB-dependent receptor plug domain-containing protein [Cellvibrionaceae bacterium]